MLYGWEVSTSNLTIDLVSWRSKWSQPGDNGLVTRAKSPRAFASVLHLIYNVAQIQLGSTTE